MSAGISANIGGVMRELGGGLRVFAGALTSAPGMCQCPFEPLFILFYDYNSYSGIGFGANGNIYFLRRSGTFMIDYYQYEKSNLIFSLPCQFIAFG